MSLAILVSATASVLSVPDRWTSGSLDASASKKFSAGRNGCPVIVAQFAAEILGEPGGRVQPGADRGAALRQPVGAVFDRRLDPAAAAVELVRIAREFVAERERGRILEMRAADLDDVGPGLCLRVERRVQPVERGQQALRRRERRGDVERGREAVVRRLAHD